MNIIPLNGHIVIEPVKQESFIASERNVYQEIGTVLVLPKDYPQSDNLPKVGDKVMFDAWLGKKYPKEGTDEFCWLIKFENVVAYVPQVSE